MSNQEIVYIHIESMHVYNCHNIMTKLGYMKVGNTATHNFTATVTGY